MTKKYYSRLLVLLSLLFSVAFVYFIVVNNYLATYIKVAAIVIMVLIYIISFSFANSKRKILRFMAGIAAIILSVAQIFGIGMLKEVDQLLYLLGNDGGKNIVVYVLKNSEATQDSLQGQDIGVLPSSETLYLTKANEKIKGNLVTGSSYKTIFKDLKYGKLKAVIANEADTALIRKEYPQFDYEVKQLVSIFVRNVFNDMRVSKISENPYTIYISGIDQFGVIPDTGLSDVNILLTVNPKTNKILMTHIPRDAFIKNACTNSELKDKLTHIGNSGIECSMRSISNALGVKINYYMKVNFSSIEQLVDVLGGIDVDSDVAFNSYGMDEEEYHFEFNKGNNHLNGKQALVFARIRKVFEDGDEQRGRNQQKVLMGIVKKIQNPSIIGNYPALLRVIGQNIRTSFSKEELEELARNQLNENPKWQILTQQITGESELEYTQSYPNEQLSIIELDKQSIQKAIDKIQSFMAEN